MIGFPIVFQSSAEILAEYSHCQLLYSHKEDIKWFYQGKTIEMVIFGHFLTTQKFNLKKFTHFFSKLLSVSIQAIESERQRDSSSILVE